MDLVRCSSLDRTIECAGSLVPTDTPYNPNNPMAMEGTANHEALAYVAKGEDSPVEEIAARYGLDPDEIALIVRLGRQAWEETKLWFKGDARAEVPLQGVVCKGTADVLAIQRNLLLEEIDMMAVLDWKTGWSMTEHPSQLMGYADCARETFGMPNSGYILGVEAWVRHREMRVHKFTEAALDEFRSKIRMQVELTGRQYAAGAHCTFCPRVHECQARADYLHATVAAIGPVKETGLTRDDIGKLYERSKMLASALRAYDKLLNDELTLGPLPLGDGRLLTLVDKDKDVIQPQAAWGVLMQELDGAELDSVLSVGKTKLLAAVKNKTQKGKGAEAQRKVLHALREAGAISKRTTRQKAIIDGPTNKE